MRGCAVPGDGTDTSAHAIFMVCVQPPGVRMWVRFGDSSSSQVTSGGIITCSPPPPHSPTPSLPHPQTDE